MQLNSVQGFLAGTNIPRRAVPAFLVMHLFLAMAVQGARSYRAAARTALQYSKLCIKSTHLAQLRQRLREPPEESDCHSRSADGCSNLRPSQLRGFNKPLKALMAGHDKAWAPGGATGPSIWLAFLRISKLAMSLLLFLQSPPHRGSAGTDNGSSRCQDERRRRQSHRPRCSRALRGPGPSLLAAHEAGLESTVCCSEGCCTVIFNRHAQGRGDMHQ